MIIEKVMNLLSILFDEKIQLAPIIGAIIAAVIVIIGWFIVAYFNRKNEIAKELRGYRSDLLSRIIQSSFELSQGNFNKNLMEDVNLKIQLYGKKDENECFRDFEKKLRIWVADNQNFDKKKEVADALQKLVDISIKRFREELKLGKLNVK